MRHSFPATSNYFAILKGVLPAMVGACKRLSAVDLGSTSVNAFNHNSLLICILRTDARNMFAAKPCFCFSITCFPCSKFLLSRRHRKYGGLRERTIRGANIPDQQHREVSWPLLYNQFCSYAQIPQRVISAKGYAW